MRRELILHFSAFLIFFAFVILLQRFFDWPYLLFLLGGIIGTFLPDIDHLIYVLFLQPQELTSQRINLLLNKQEIKRVVSLLYITRSERRGLIFHTVFFQMVFLVFTFWILSSSGSLFGKGMTLAFCIHLLVDQYIDLMKVGSFDNWLKYSPINLDLEKAKIYWVVVMVVVVMFGVFL